MTAINTTYMGFTADPALREARRQFVVKAVFFIFILSLIEGPLRKWFLPGLSGPLTLLRDPLVIALYAYCLGNGLMLRRGIAALWLGFAVITSIFGLAQYAAQGLPVWGWMLGVRTYWLYMPLAFVVAKTFKREDIHRFLKLNLWIAIPYALLIVTQYNAPAYSFLNRGVGGDEGGAVALGGGILRPFGLFTYTGPNVQFTAFMVAAFVAFYVDSVRIRRRGLFLLASGASVGMMSVLTGSRSIYFLVAVIVGLTLLGMIFTRPSGRNLRRALGVLSFAGLAAGLFVFSFSDMLDAMAMRFEQAARSEGSIWNRVFGDLFVWIEPLFTTSILGGGIGAGASAMTKILGLPYMLYGEADLQRNVNELGFLLGVAMLVLRFGTSIWIVWLGAHLARKKVILVLPLVGFGFVPLLMGAITNSPLSAFLVWLSFGIILSLRKHKRSRL